ncbi:MAG: L,D-transpeptidase [Gammaproteobacteria bacterium]|nr:MAG: L,D-transpeptidase [Gammaproteobacteria bacterium]
MPEPRHSIEIVIPSQTLTLRDAKGRVILQTLVSTARKGPGERANSECTPRGRHVIRAKIGAGAPTNAVFASRRPTGEIYTPALRALYPQRDWILTRILWLSGLEPGINRLGGVDTMRRFIYIHGAPNEDVMGTPSSHGCIKMHNRDVVTLFDQVAPGTPVIING